MSLFRSTSNFVRKDCGQDVFFFLIYVFFLFWVIFIFVLFFFIGFVFFTTWWALDSVWPTLFLILKRQVVSIMCEKCLLYSFKKFQAEYKTLYINLSISTCSEGVLSVCWVPDSDSEISLLFKCPWRRLVVFPSGRHKERQNSLSRCKTQVLIVWHYFIIVFPLLDIDKDHVYK